MEITGIQQKSSSSPGTERRISRAIGHRRFAIGDVHGCSKTLRALVEEKICLMADDTLYLLGDYIDRGPDSKGVLDYLLDLRNSNYDIRPLRGNHEQLLLDSVSDLESQRLWYENGGWGTMREFGVTSPAEIPQLYRDFLGLLPRLIVTDDYVLTHAGLDFKTADPIHDTSDYDLLWIRDSNVQPEKLGGRTLVCGHTVTPLFTIEQSLHSPVIYLDNGCFDKGHSCYGSLVALNLDSRKLLVQENIEQTAGLAAPSL